MLQKLGHRERVMVILLAVVVVCFAFYKYIAYPQIELYINLKKQLNDTRSRIATARQNIVLQDTEKKGAGESSAKYKEILASFNARLEDGGLLVNLGLDAMHCGVKIVSYQPGHTTDNQYYLEIPVAMKIRGPYLNLLSFLEKLENQKTVPNLMEIKSLEISITEEKTPVIPYAAASEKTQELAQKTGQDAREGEEKEVMAKISLVYFSIPNPEEILARDQITGWKLGRQDPFRQAEMISPYQGVKPYGSIKQDAIPGFSEEPFPGKEKTSP